MSNLPEQPTLTIQQLYSLYNYADMMLSKKNELNLSDEQCAAIRLVKRTCIEAVLKWYSHQIKTHTL